MPAVLSLALGLLFAGPLSAQQSTPTITTQPLSQTVNPGTLVVLQVVAAGATTYQWYENGSPVGSNLPSLSFLSAQIGVFQFYVVASSSSGYDTSLTANVTFAVVAAPVLTNATAATATAGSPFSLTITATGLPSGFAASGLPAGLQVDGTTGILSGSPTTAGVYPVTLSATNAVGTGAAALSLTVSPAPPTPTLYAYEQVGQTGQFYSQTSPFSGPTGVAVDSKGNITVADAGSDTIRTVTGTVIAGQPNLVGGADGPAATAHFFKPSGIAVDSSGTLYVTDTGNDTIRTVSTSGVVATLAGSAQQAGSTDGAGSAARFSAPLGIAVDSGGNLYVADSGNQTIRKVTPDGNVTTLAGSPGQTGTADGTGSAARFNNPVSVAVDMAGNVYVADSGNDTIREISPSGATTTIAGTPGVDGSNDGFGTTARFSAPSGVVVDAFGDVFVADTGNNVMREIIAGGYTSTLSGWQGINPPPTQGTVFINAGPQGFYINRYSEPTLSKPTGLAIDGQGDLYWLNPENFGEDVYEALPYTPVTITSAPASVSLFSGQSAAFTVTATGGPLNYVWIGPTLSSYGQGYVLSASSTFDVTALLEYDSSGYNYYTNGGTYGVIAYNIGSSASASFSVEVDPSPPVIAGPLPSQSVVAGQSLTLTASVDALAGNAYIVSGIAYSWAFNGVAIPGANGPTYTITNAQASDAGNYSLTAAVSYFANGSGYQAPPVSVTSTSDTVTLNPAAGPQITAEPSSASVYAGASATLTVIATGAPAPTYQWSLNGLPISGATGSSYTIPSATPADAGNYTVAVTNSVGTAVSATAVLTVVSGPVISVQPVSTAVRAGGNVTLSVTAAGQSLTYQWAFDGTAITGATTSTLPITNIGSSSAGSYTVVVSNAAGSVTSNHAAVSVNTTRLINLSARGLVGQGANALIAGFVTQGAAPKELLLRGIGPTLGSFGVTGFLANPQLALMDANGATLASNSGWDGTVALQDAFLQVGAFPLPGTSADAALLQTLPGGANTAEVTGANGGSGVALAEIYDADPGTPASRLINLSARAFVGTNANVLIAGFVIAGNSAETVLIRGVGPGLTNFGVTGVLASPQLTVTNSAGTTVAQNAGWGGTASLAATFSNVGAFALSTSSSDAALVVTLQPGSYTAQLSGVGATTGIALVEIYEVQ